MVVAAAEHHSRRRASIVASFNHCIPRYLLDEMPTPERILIPIIKHFRTPHILQKIHTATKEFSAAITIRDLLRTNASWDFLNLKLDSVEFTGSLVAGVLLELTDSADAKRALSFFHWSARRKNSGQDIRSYGIMVQILVRARLLEHARALLESVIRKSTGAGSSRFEIVDSLLSTYASTHSGPFLFDFLIQTYAKLRMFELAFDMCRYLEERGFSSSLITFNVLIHVTQKSDQNSLVWKMYEYMIEKRVYPNAATVQIMINSMCKEGILKKHVDILDRILGKRCVPAVIVNTSLIYRIFEEKRVDEGIQLLKRMLQKNMIPDDVAYSLIIYGHCRTGKAEVYHELYEDMLRRGYRQNSFLYTLFIGMCCEDGEIVEAKRLLEEMLHAGLKPYDETYDSLVGTCCKAGVVNDALTFYEEMLEKGFLPSCIACNDMIRKLCEVGEAEKANGILTVLLEKGFLPSEETYSLLIDGYGRERNTQEVLKLYNEMKFKGPTPGLMVYTSLIRSLCVCQKVNEAEKCLSAMEDIFLSPTAQMYDWLIDGHCEHGNMERALHFYNEMIRKGLEPGAFTPKFLAEQSNGMNGIQSVKELDSFEG